MTNHIARKILGVTEADGPEEIKKKYRKLMKRAHPDSDSFRDEKGDLEYSAHEINAAYECLCSLDEPQKHRKMERAGSGEARKNKKQQQDIFWNAPVNSYAYCERQIFHSVEDEDGNKIGAFPIAEGKYFLSEDEEFSLFLKSMYFCGKKLLDQVDEACDRSVDETDRISAMAELTYLLASQFIDKQTALRKWAREEVIGENTVFHMAAMVELCDSFVWNSRQAHNRRNALREGDILYPHRVRDHKLYVKNAADESVGYLSFRDDRLYYVVIPLFEERAVQLKLVIAGEDFSSGKKKSRNKEYKNADLWIRFSDRQNSMPESVNMQIETLLKRYETEYGRGEQKCGCTFRECV